MKQQFNFMIATIMLIVGTGVFTACGGDSFTDSRDGKKYKTVKIGEQVWMAENLKYKTDGYSCPNDDPENCVSWGNLYGISKLNSDPCPQGWHIPTTIEFKFFLDYVKEKFPDIGVGVALKSTTGWDEGIDNAEEKYGKRKGNGDDVVGFNAKPMPKGGAEFITIPTGYQYGKHSGLFGKKILGFKNYENTFSLDRGVNYEYGNWLGAIRCVENSGLLAKKLIPILLLEFLTDDVVFSNDDAQLYPDSVTQFNASCKVIVHENEKDCQAYMGEFDSKTIVIKIISSIEGCPQGSEWKISLSEQDGKRKVIFEEPQNDKCNLMLAENYRDLFKSNFDTVSEKELEHKANKIYNELREQNMTMYDLRHDFK